MNSNSKSAKKLVRKLLGKNSEKYVQPNYLGDESVMAGSCIIRGINLMEAYDAIVIYDQRRKIYEPDDVGSIRGINVELDVVTVRKLWRERDRELVSSRFQNSSEREYGS